MSNKIRMYVENALSEHATFEPVTGKAHYLSNVMRRKIGETTLCFNGKDGLWLAEIISITKKSCEMRAIKQLATQQNCKRLILMFAPVKGESASYMVQKATELGVTDIYPVLMQRSVVRSVNYERLRVVAIEAAEQCERLDVPKIFPLQPLSSLLEKKIWTGTLIFCHERHKGQKLQESLTKARGNCNAVLLGPEGGFSDEEVAMLGNIPSVLPVSLGGRILRSETALVGALAVYQTILGDW